MGHILSCNGRSKHRKWGGICTHEKFLILILSMLLFVTSAFAENVDLTSVSLDELQALQGRIEAEIKSRDADEQPRWFDMRIGSLLPKPL